MAFALELAVDGRVMLWRSVDRRLMSVGRNPNCDLCIPDERVAPIQLLLANDEGGLRLLNRHPNGTLVNGAKVERQPLKRGDEIQMGRLVIEVTLPE